MPWTYVPKKEHRCKTPVVLFKPIGSKWQCPDCLTVYVVDADMHGRYLVKVS